ALSAAHGSDRRSAGGISCERAADDRADGDGEQDDEWEEHVATTVAAHRPPASVFAAFCRTFGSGSKSADCRRALTTSASARNVSMFSAHFSRTFALASFARAR